MLRKPLGRGLDALIENTKPQAAADAAPVLMMVAVERIVAGPFQPRRNFDPERLLELTRSPQCPLYCPRHKQDSRRAHAACCCGPRSAHAASELFSP